MKQTWALLWGCALALLPLAGHAQAFPTKPIVMIVPFAAGGPTDVLARALAKGMTAELGQTIVIENRVGAGGSIAMADVARAAPDGYTITLANTGSVSINPFLYPKHSFDPRSDLTAITPVVSYTNVLLVNSKLPVKSVSEFVAWTKLPDVSASYASGGNGATNHLSGEILKSLTGAKITHVPYKGNAPAMVDLIAGNVSAMFDIPITAIPQIRGGKVRPLAVTSRQRSEFLPDVPTMKEAGVPGFEEAGNDLWFGILGPAALPPAVLSRLHESIVKAMATPDLQLAIRSMAYEPWTLSTEAFKSFIKTDYEKWGQVVKLSGAKLE
jgi:tripartite-type tricarboxylate transporter receptor subunit TctC